MSGSYSFIQSKKLFVDQPDEMISLFFSYLGSKDRDKLASINPRLKRIGDKKESKPFYYPEYRRIQGEFIKKWGSWGNENGQWSI